MVETRVLTVQSTLKMVWTLSSPINRAFSTIPNPLWTAVIGV
jgi:hypothetical protein